MFIFSVFVANFWEVTGSGTGSPSLAWHEKKGDNKPRRARRAIGKVFIVVEVKDILPKRLIDRKSLDGSVKFLFDFDE
jgi:hypothetical protein